MLPVSGATSLIVNEIEEEEGESEDDFGARHVGRARCRNIAIGKITIESQMVLGKFDS